MSNYYQKSIELLLGGVFICELTHPEVFEYLENEDNRSRVNDYLVVLNRVIRKTNDSKSFVCAFNNVDSTETNRVIRDQFKDFVNQLEPMVNMLALMINVKDTNEPVKSGDLILETEMLNAIEASSVLQDKLAKLTSNGIFKSEANTVKPRVAQLLKKLVESDYLIPVGSSGIQYQATGKWSWLYDNLHFIQVHEKIELDSQEEYREEQVEMF